MHPIKSFEAHYQTYVIKHFSKSKYSTELRKFRNKHDGETCFIVGNGPSLSPDDLEVLHKNNIPTFGFNRIFLMFEKTSWRPTYYISQDEKMLKNCVKQVNEMKLPYKFIPLQWKYYFGINIDKALYFNMEKYGSEKIEIFGDFANVVENSNTVAYTAAQLAAYMGFKKIYLIGVDHSFSVVKNDKGEIIRDENAKDYFTDAYNTDKNELYIPNLDASTRTFLKMKKNCDANGIEVYNATRGGKLEVFPRVDFDKVIREIKSNE